MTDLVKLRPRPTLKDYKHWSESHSSAAPRTCRYQVSMLIALANGLFTIATIGLCNTLMQEWQVQSCTLLVTFLALVDLSICIGKNSVILPFILVFQVILYPSE